MSMKDLNYYEQYDNKTALDIEAEKGKEIADEWKRCKQVLRVQGRVSLMDNDQLLQFVTGWREMRRLFGKY